MLNTLVHHCEAVLHLRFSNSTMVTCSKVCALNRLTSSATNFSSLSHLCGYRQSPPQTPSSDTAIYSVFFVFPLVYPLACMQTHIHVHVHVHTLAITYIISKQDRTIAVWDMRASHDIVLRRVLVGHRAAVNVVDFDDKYIVSASGDRTIKVRGALHDPHAHTITVYVYTLHTCRCITVYVYTLHTCVGVENIDQ